VQKFLVSIPPDYYTVRQISKVKALTKKKQSLLVDVREPSEYASGHIKGAINIPLRSLSDNLNQIPKNAPVILYCSTGYRTAMGVMALQMLGYHNVRGFPPSIEGWKTAGEKLEK
jgi:rhodanese-related sulfurtransferase